MPSQAHNPSERRTHPRLKKSLSLKVKSPTFDLVAETQNISLSGVYCQLNRKIELMSKVAITLLLPVRLKTNKVVTRTLKCEGVVVRVEQAQEAKGKFNIAVFFNNLTTTAQNSLKLYIESHLSQNTLSASKL